MNYIFCIHFSWGNLSVTLASKEARVQAHPFCSFLFWRGGGGSNIYSIPHVVFPNGNPLSTPNTQYGTQMYLGILYLW